MINSIIANYSARIWGESQVQVYYSNRDNAKEAWEDFRKMIGKDKKIVIFEAKEYDKYNKYSKSKEFSCFYYHPIHVGNLYDDLNISEEDTEKSTKITELNIESIKDIKI